MEEQRKKRDTKTIGDRSEIEVIRALARAGHLVSVPFGENHRYDLIADKDGAVQRVQVKTGRLRNGAIVFNCYSSHSHRNGVSCRTYSGEVEAFAVYCPEIDSVFFVPIEDVSIQRASLRWLPARNRHNRAVRWASRYLVSEPNLQVGSGGLGDVSGPRSDLTLPL